MGQSLLTHSRHNVSQVDQHILDLAIEQAEAAVARCQLETMV